MNMLKPTKNILIVYMIVSMLFLCSCSTKGGENITLDGSSGNSTSDITVHSDAISNETTEDETSTDSPFLEPEVFVESGTDNGEAIKQIYSTNSKIRELDSISGIDDVVVIVSGKGITRRDVETAKIMRGVDITNDNETVKSILHNLMKHKAMKAEAERLNIEPDAADVEKYWKPIKDEIYDENADEFAKADMISLGLTKEEYVQRHIQIGYDMYQREALFKFAAPAHGDYDRFADELIKKAKIEFLDKELEDIYTQ
ncbi:MAG: hypothetical protein E7395_06555 [Ruminococcaceae bacterium]|nr:hypothetical protein [Oscillospiraceae bacterium]